MADHQLPHRGDAQDRGADTATAASSAGLQQPEQLGPVPPPSGKGGRSPSRGSGRPPPRLGIRPHRFMADRDGDCWCDLPEANRHHVEPPVDELASRILGEKPEADQ